MPRMILSQSPPVGTAWILFLLVAGLLTVFVLGIALLTWRRTRRPSRTKSEASVSETDPWSEAGRRAQPYDEDRD